MAPRATIQASPTTKPQARPVGRPRKLIPEVAAAKPPVTAPKRGRPRKANPAASAAIKPATPPVPAPSSRSKKDQLIEMLRSAPGATVDQMTALTGWQAHTVRGMISGVLRKRMGLTVVHEVSADSNGRVYRITEQA